MNQVFFDATGEINLKYVLGLSSQYKHSKISFKSIIQWIDQSLLKELNKYSFKDFTEFPKISLYDRDYNFNFEKEKEQIKKKTKEHKKEIKIQLGGDSSKIARYFITYKYDEWFGPYELAGNNGKKLQYVYVNLNPDLSKEIYYKIFIFKKKSITFGIGLKFKINLIGKIIINL